MVDPKQQQINDLIGHRRDWTPVGVLIENNEALEHRLVEVAETKRWRLVALETYDGHVPARLALRGALVSGVPDMPTALELRASGVPTVRIGNLPHPDDHLMPAVLPDKRAFGRLATEHFAQRGFKHIGFVGRDPWGDNQSLYEGFAARAVELGITCHAEQFSNEALGILKRQFAARDRWLTQSDLFKSWLGKTPKPLGLLCINNVVSGRFSLWAMEMGLAIPQDVAVLCITSRLFQSTGSHVPLSSIEQDHERTIVSATDLLEKLMAGGPAPKTPIMIPPKGIITRQSTDVLAASDPRVVKALRFMWEHVSDNLSVDQIVDHVGVSRSTLEKAFKKDLGRGINTEYQRRRLEKARELIATTRLPIADIAEAMNYSSHSYFCFVFNARFGHPPADFRPYSEEHPEQ
ncbi:MAG: helix-turn-helix domain-containing protein [Phycisphaera sp.]|nr:helix-turn-helix domain-containing protein [Phycisphaera sp.]